MRSCGPQDAMSSPSGEEYANAVEYGMSWSQMNLGRPISGMYHNLNREPPSSNSSGEAQDSDVIETFSLLSSCTSCHLNSPCSLPVGSYIYTLCSSQIAMRPVDSSNVIACSGWAASIYSVWRIECGPDAMTAALPEMYATSRRPSQCAVLTDCRFD